MWKISTAQETDIQAINRDLGARLTPERRPVFEDKVARYVRKPDRALFMALTGSRVIGFSTIIENPEIGGELTPGTAECVDGLAMITGLLVSPDHRGQGIGQALVRSMEAWAAGRSLPGIWLVTRRQAAWYRRHFDYQIKETINVNGIQKTVMAKVFRRSPI